MTTTTTSPSVADVPLPAGMEWADDEWQRGTDLPYRFVWGKDREVSGRHGTFGTAVSAAQYCTGPIDTEGRIEPPLVHVTSGRTDVGTLTAAEARQLARLLIAAADELEALNGAER